MLAIIRTFLCCMLFCCALPTASTGQALSKAELKDSIELYQYKDYDKTKYFVKMLQAVCAETEDWENYGFSY